MTVLEYYKHFKSIYGGVTAAISSIPLLALIPVDYSQYLFPPLGAYETFYKIASLILLVVVTLIVYFTKDGGFVNSKKGRLKVLLACGLLAFVSLLGLFALSQRFIRAISIASEHKDVIVSVGYQRTAFADKEFPNSDDWDLLKQRGHTEQDIGKLWTWKSIMFARLTLLAAYLGFMLSVVAIGSCAVLYDRSGPPANP